MKDNFDIKFPALKYHVYDKHDYAANLRNALFQIARYSMKYTLETAKKYNIKNKGDCYMDLNLQITDMAGDSPDHSLVIVNFVTAIRKQLKNSTCFVYPGNVQYRFKTDDDKSKILIPDASINCRIKSRRGNAFLDAPRFVMEVLAPSTEKYDRGEKMELYRQQEIEEYWIVDWRKKQVEIYELDYEENIPKYYLWKTITEGNKEELKIIHFPNIKIDFDELFDEINFDADQ